MRVPDRRQRDVDGPIGVKDGCVLGLGDGVVLCLPGALKGTRAPRLVGAKSAIAIHEVGQGSRLSWSAIGWALSSTWARPCEEIWRTDSPRRGVYRAGQDLSARQQLGESLGPDV